MSGKLVLSNPWLRALDITSEPPMLRTAGMLSNEQWLLRVPHRNSFLHLCFGGGGGLFLSQMETGPEFMGSAICVGNVIWLEITNPAPLCCVRARLSACVAGLKHCKAIGKLTDTSR